MLLDGVEPRFLTDLAATPKVTLSVLPRSVHDPSWWVEPAIIRRDGGICQQKLVSPQSDSLSPPGTGLGWGAGLASVAKYPHRHSGAGRRRFTTAKLVIQSLRLQPCDDNQALTPLDSGLRRN